MFSEEILTMITNLSIKTEGRYLPFNFFFDWSRKEINSDIKTVSNKLLIPSYTYSYMEQIPFLSIA